MIDQEDVNVSKTHRAPPSSIGVMSIPPRPENIYTFPFSVVHADPTRGEGADVRGFVSTVEYSTNTLAGPLHRVIAIRTEVNQINLIIDWLSGEKFSPKYQYCFFNNRENLR